MLKESNSDVALVDVIKATGGNVRLHEAALTEVAAEDGIDLSTITNSQRDKLSKKAKERYLAI